MTLPAFTTAADYCARLGIAVPTGLPLVTMSDALADASDMLRDAIGQGITPQTSTLQVEINEFGFGLVPVSPITSVTSIVDNNGVTLPADGTAYQLFGQRLSVYEQYRSFNLYADLDPLFAVTVTHGWPTIPGEIMRWCRMLAAAQIAAVSMGNLGITVTTSIAVDDAKVTLAPGPAVTIPAEHKARLKAMYGGEQR